MSDRVGDFPHYCGRGVSGHAVRVTTSPALAVSGLTVRYGDGPAAAQQPTQVRATGRASNRAGAIARPQRSQVP